MIDLIIKLDTVTLLRELSRQPVPDPIELMFAAEAAGANGIALHFRDDRKYVQERDLRLLKQLVKSQFNLEISPTQETLRLALELKPDSVTLVGNSREEGIGHAVFDIMTHAERLQVFTKTLHEAQIRVGTFIEPEVEQVRTAHRCQADFVEIATFALAGTIAEPQRQHELNRLLDAANLANKLKLRTVATGALNLRVSRLLLESKVFQAIKLDHAIMVRALLVGIEQAVREAKGVLEQIR